MGGALFHRLQSQDSLKNSVQDYINIHQHHISMFLSGNLWHRRWAVSQHTELNRFNHKAHHVQDVRLLGFLPRIFNQLLRVVGQTW